MDGFKLTRDGMDSPFAAQLRQGFSNLRFDGLLEKEFREFYAAQNLPRARLSGFIALFLVLAVTGVDLSFGESALFERINVLRIFAVCPLLVLLIAGSYVPAFARRYSAMSAAGTAAIGLIVTYICHYGALGGASYLLAGPLIVILYACLFIGLLFHTAVSVSSFLVAAHFATGLVVGLPLNELFYMGAILAGVTVIAGISTYNLEHALRTNFLETRLLNELAERDGLTGLYNRRIFDELIRRIWRQSRRDEATVEIIFIDIDYFKIYNDLYGHQAGDDCLKKVAQTIARSAKRPLDFCARYGGEEFVLVVHGPPPEHARALPEQIRRDVMDLGILHEGSEIVNFVTVSVGVALARPGSGRSLVGAIQAADEALYEAKQSGRNRVVFKDASESEIETGNFRVAAYREMA